MLNEYAAYARNSTNKSIYYKPTIHVYIYIYRDIIYIYIQYSHLGVDKTQTFQYPLTQMEIPRYIPLKVPYSICFGMMSLSLYIYIYIHNNHDSKNHNSNNIYMCVCMWVQKSPGIWKSWKAGKSLGQTLPCQVFEGYCRVYLTPTCDQKQVSPVYTMSIHMMFCCSIYIYIYHICA